MFECTRRSSTSLTREDWCSWAEGFGEAPDTEKLVLVGLLRPLLLPPPPPTFPRFVLALAVFLLPPPVLVLLRAMAWPPPTDAAVILAVCVEAFSRVLVSPRQLDIWHRMFVRG